MSPCSRTSDRVTSTTSASIARGSSVPDRSSSAERKTRALLQAGAEDLPVRVNARVRDQLRIEGRLARGYHPDRRVRGSIDEIDGS